MNKTSSLIIAGLIFLSCLNLQSQEVQRSDSSSNAGKKAITFSLNGLYLGGGLGGTYWINSDYSLRVLLNGTYSIYSDLTRDGSTYDASIGLTTYLRKHFHAGNVLSPYIGMGIGLSYYQSTSYYSSEISRSGGVKIPAIAGIEYWFTDHISLAGEQSVGLSFSVNRDSRRYEVSSSTSSLLLSVYF